MYDPNQPLQPQSQVDRDAQLATIYQYFVSMRDEWVEHRAKSGIETKWKKWQALNDGNHEEEVEANAFVETLKSGPNQRRKDVNRSRVVINIVRPKVDAAIARHCEILLPTDDRNWGADPTPVPELSEIANDKQSNIIDMHTGQPMDVVAGQIMQQAKKACEGMVKEIDDVLTECNYNGESREVIAHGVRLGTGVMKGPFPWVRRAKKWSPGPDGQAILEIHEDVRPRSEARSCWDIYPDKACGNNLHRGRGVFERSKVNRKELRDLCGVPGFFEDRIKMVLQQKPSRIGIGVDGSTTRNVPTDDMYEMWEYHGEIDPDDMLYLTMDQEDPLDVDNGMIVVVNDIIIGALKSITPDGSIPYDFWCYREQDDSPWGIGLPEELEHQQRVIKAAWRQLMDNAAAGAGFHIIIKKGQIIPQGQRQGDYVIGSRMVWEANEDIDDVRTAFDVRTIDMRVNELLSMVDAAMKFADAEANMPQMLGGEQGTAPETVGGMQMLMANAQGPLRHRIKRYDDNITRPQITRHYDWQMSYSPKQQIKGDFQINPRGATYLLERDIQAQATLNLGAVTADPRFAPHVDPRKMLQKILTSMRIAPDDVMKPEEQVQQEQQAQAQNPPQDPRIVAAQTMLQAKQLDIADRKEARQTDLVMQNNELNVKHEEILYNAERERAQSEQDMAANQLQRELAVAKMDSETRNNEAILQSKERLETINLNQKAQLFNAEAALRVRTGAGI